MLRRAALFVVGLAGVLTTVATSPVRAPATASVRSDPSTITVVLDDAQPALRFTVTAAGNDRAPNFARVRAEVRVDEDDDPATDGVTLADVGLLDLPAGGDPALPADVELDDDPATAAVAEGTFAVTREIDPATLVDGVDLVLATRLRPDVDAARLTVVVAVEAEVFSTTDAAVDLGLTIDVAPRPGDGSPAAEDVPPPDADETPTP
jgi:hypothetical protein